MIPASLRWRLPLSYALIALLTAVSLNLILFTTLNGFYQRQEFNYLTGNARAIGNELEPLLVNELTADSIPAMVEGMAFLSQTRVKVLTADKAEVLADSGERGLSDSSTQITLDVEVDGVAQSFSQSVTDGESGIQANTTVTSSIVLETGLFNNNVEEMVIVQSRETVREETAVPAPRLPVQGTLFGFGFNPEAANAEERSNIVIEYPMFNGGGGVAAYVQLSEGPAYGREILDSVVAGGFVASIVAVLLAAGAGWLASRRLTLPLTALNEVTQKMAAGDLSARADLVRQDELGALGLSFNKMAQRIQGTVTTLQQFVADAAHELHTPLTALLTNLELLRDKHADDVRVSRAIAQANRLEQLTNSLLDLSRIEGVQVDKVWEPIDLTTLLYKSGERYASRAEQQGSLFVWQETAVPITILGNETQIRQAIDNVLDNSLKFTPADGEIRLGVRREGEWAVVEVLDTGIGIPKADQPQLFNRFHRGRNTVVYPGSGLGLAIVKAIVEGHNGRLQISSPGVDQGCHVTIYLPLLERF
ncbi:MAG: HAMP domain-containing sensor histidine kinase [Chloroflexota bacterium]